jgi:lipid-A-disaccharide synthase
MTPKRIMIIAGETSGDMLAAELVRELRDVMLHTQTYTPDHQPLQADLAPRFFGAGGPRMAEAGVELAFDMTRHSVTGLSDVLKNYFKFKRLFDQLFALAVSREPHAIICVDFSGFNRRFAAAIKDYIRARQRTFNNWDPKIIQYVSPQVWASRPGRADQLARDVDLLLSIFPFEKDWYAARVPKLRVEFVGHPMIDRYQGMQLAQKDVSSPPLLLLLPGSRSGELNRHLPPMLAALKLILPAVPGLRARMVLPTESLVTQAKHLGVPSTVDVRCGGLAESLSEATLAIASTGTVTMECAFFGVPAVTLYKTSWFTYEIGKLIVKVKSLTMPNLLAKEEIFPEFIQDAATPKNISDAALKLLRNPERREFVKSRLAKIISSLGGPGASRRAAEAIVKMLQ